MRIWTGIGARHRLPEGHSSIQRGIGQEMCEKGWKLYSGGALGSDYNYLSGVCSVSEKGIPVNALVIRHKGVRTGTLPRSYTVPVATMSEEEYEFALDYYFRHDIFGERSFRKMDHHPRYLHARNFYQVMKAQILFSEPCSDVVIYSARENSFGNIEGGTRTAVAVARIEGIQTFNTYKPKQLRALYRFIRKL